LPEALPLPLGDHLQGARALENINKAASRWHGEVLRRLSPQELARGRKFLQALAAVARAATKEEN
jgi:hypothetical protein